MTAPETGAEGALTPVVSPAPADTIAAPSVEYVSAAPDLPSSVRTNLFLARRARERMAKHERQRDAVLGKVAPLERELEQVEKRLKVTYSGDDRAARDQLLANIEGPRAELAKVDTEIDRCLEVIEVCDYLVANPPAETPPEELEHPVVEELKSAVADATAAIETAEEAMEAADAEVKTAERALALDKSPPAVRVETMTGERTTLERPTRKRWVDALEQQIRAREGLKDAKVALSKAERRLSDKGAIERAIAVHDERERREAARTAEREALETQLHELGANLGRLIKEARGTSVDEWAFRKVLTAGIEAAGIDPWDARDWIKPA